MKITQLLLFTACLVNTAALLPAQENTVPAELNTLKKHRHFPLHAGLGANILPLAKAIRGDGADTTGLNPWLLDGCVLYRRLGIRGSFGGAYQSDKKFIEGFRDSETHTVSAMSYRAGIFYRAAMNRRFTADFGVDWAVFHHSDEIITDSGFDVIERINQSDFAGGGLSMGVNWRMTRRLGLRLDMGYYYLTGERNRARRFINFPELDDEIDNFDITEFRVPVGLFITFSL